MNAYESLPAISAQIAPEPPLMMSLQGGPPEYVVTRDDIKKFSDEDDTKLVQGLLYNGLAKSGPGCQFLGTRSPIISRDISELGHVFSYGQLAELVQPSEANNQQSILLKYQNLGELSVKLLQKVLEQKKAEIDAAQLG